MNNGSLKCIFVNAAVTVLLSVFLQAVHLTTTIYCIRAIHYVYVVERYPLGDSVKIIAASVCIVLLSLIEVCI